MYTPIVGATCHPRGIGQFRLAPYHRCVITAASIAPTSDSYDRSLPDGWTSRFAPLASAAFDTWFSAELTAMAGEVADAIGPSFSGLVLGGGYGRGEGGIVVRSGVERPYNDVDLFLFAERPRRVPTAALGAISARYHRRLGVDVDFSRPYRPSEIAAWRPTLMWHELAAGHVVLKGPASLVDHLCPPIVREAPPATEALRLLLNRGAGLLWALRVMYGCEPAPDPDFVRRNYYKCLLGCGDALLIAHRAYGRSFVSRIDRLKALPAASLGANRAALLEGYEAARQFKLSPDSAEPGPPSIRRLKDAAALWSEALLTVEWVRTGRPWPSVSAYNARSGVRESGSATAGERLRHLARNFRDGQLAAYHPREPLYRQLPALLTVPPRDTTTWPHESARFLNRWRAAH